MEVTSTKKEIWTMGSYAFVSLSIMTVVMYVNTFATEVLMIPATTLAFALLVAKSVDFVISLCAGAIIEKVKIGTKGKNQSWLYLGRWILAVSILLSVCNTSTAPMVVRVAVLSVSYTALGSIMNILQPAYYGVLAAVAGPNLENRNAMTINMTRQSTVIIIITSFIPVLVTVLPFGSWNYFIVSLIFLIPMPIALGKMADAAEGKDAPVSSGGSDEASVSIGDMIKTLTQNPQMMILFLAFTVLYIGEYMYEACYTYYFIYVVGDFAKLTVATLVASIVGFVAAMVMPKVCSKLGKKGSSVFGFVLFGLGLIGTAFLGIKSWIFYIICISIGSFGTYTYMPFMVTLFLDCGEYYLWKTGKDTRAIATSLSSPPMKIGMALGGTIGLYALGAIGYVAGFTPDAAWSGKLMYISFLIPGLIYIAAALIMLFGYKIKDVDAAKYAQENAEKMSQES